jgi:penicillin-binding protein 1A
MGDVLKSMPVVPPPAPPAGLSRVNGEWLYSEWLEGGWVSSISDTSGVQYAGSPAVLDALRDLFKP